MTGNLGALQGGPLYVSMLNTVPWVPFVWQLSKSKPQFQLFSLFCFYNSISIHQYSKYKYPISLQTVPSLKRDHGLSYPLRSCGFPAKRFLLGFRGVKMQISLFEDSKEIQLRFIETAWCCSLCQSGENHITLSYSCEIHPAYTWEYIKDICFRRIRKHHWFSNLYKVSCSTV